MLSAILTCPTPRPWAVPGKPSRWARRHGSGQPAQAIAEPRPRMAARLASVGRPVEDSADTYAFGGRWTEVSAIYGSALGRRDVTDQDRIRPQPAGWRQSADPGDIEDPDDLGGIIGVEGRQSVTGTEHCHAVGRILARRHDPRIPGLLGEGNRSLQPGIESG